MDVAPQWLRVARAKTRGDRRCANSIVGNTGATPWDARSPQRCASVGTGGVRIKVWGDVRHHGMQDGGRLLQVDEDPAEVPGVRQDPVQLRARAESADVHNTAMQVSGCDTALALTLVGLRVASRIKFFLSTPPPPLSLSLSHGTRRCKTSPGRQPWHVGAPMSRHAAARHRTRGVQRKRLSTCNRA